MSLLSMNTIFMLEGTLYKITKTFRLATNILGDKENSFLKSFFCTILFLTLLFFKKKIMKC